MCDLKICRICLRTECKFYKYDELPLKVYYEEVMCFKMQGKDELPQYFCYECAALLHKFHKFKEKCFNGRNTLKDLLFKNALNYEDVHEIYKKRKLQPNYIMNLSIVKVSRNVKTYNFVYEEAEVWEDEVEIDLIDKAPFENDDHDLDEKVKEQIDLNLCNVKDEVELNVNNFIKDTLDDPKPDLDMGDQDFDNSDFSSKIPKLDKPKPINAVTVKVASPISSEEEVPAKKVRNNKKEVTLEKLVKKKLQFQGSKKGPSKLSEGNWKKTNLSEEEAMRRFEGKALDKKYLKAPFKCTQCYKWFSKVGIYDRHKVSRHNQSLRIECRFCKMRFKQGHQLQKHMEQHYNFFECLRCPYACDLEQSAIFHDESHNGKLRTCKVCFKEFTHSSTYYSHMTTTHRTNFICTICGRSFFSEIGLELHKRRTHILENYQNDKPSNTENETIYCERCDIKFEARAAYEEHLFHSANHTEDIVDPNNELLKFQIKVRGVKEKSLLAEEIRIREQDPASSVNTSVLVKRVKGPIPIPMDCYRCGKHFKSQKECRIHHLKEHPRTAFVLAGTPERTICDICGAYLAFGSMMAHLNMHSKEKLYKCNVCERSFVQKASLTRHMVTHTGERPYPCTVCHKRFGQSATQQYHYRTVHLKQPHKKRIRRKKLEEPLPE